MRLSFCLFSILAACSGSGLGDATQGAFQADPDGEFRADLVDLAAPTGEWLWFEIDVPADAPVLTAATAGGTGDVDLYLRHGAQPTAATFACRSWEPSNDERCAVTDPVAGAWWIGLYAYEGFAGVALDWDIVLPVPVPIAGPMEVARIPVTNGTTPCVTLAGVSSRHGILDAAHLPALSGYTGEVSIAYAGFSSLCRERGSCALAFPEAERPLQACVADDMGGMGELVVTWTPGTPVVEQPVAAGQELVVDVVVPSGALGLLAELHHPEASGTVRLERGPVVYCDEDHGWDATVCPLEVPPAGTYQVRVQPDVAGQLVVSVVQ